MRLRWAVIFGLPTLLLVGGLWSVQRTDDTRVGGGAHALGLLSADVASHPDAQCIGSAIRHAGVSAESRQLIAESTRTDDVSQIVLPAKDRKPWRDAMTAARTGCPEPGLSLGTWRGVRITFSI